MYATRRKTITTIKKKFPQINIVFGTHNIASLPEYLYDAMMNQKKLLMFYQLKGIFMKIFLWFANTQKSLG